MEATFVFCHLSDALLKLVSSTLHSRILASHSTFHHCHSSPDAAIKCYLFVPRLYVCLIHKLIDVGTRKRLLFSAPLPIPSSSFCLSFLHSRLSIASAHAFLLVYSVTDPTSFASVKSRLEEIKEQRTDFEVGLTILSQTRTVPMLKPSSVQ